MVHHVQVVYALAASFLKPISFPVSCLPFCRSFVD
jgi:hypothetical protein